MPVRVPTLLRQGEKTNIVEGIAFIYCVFAMAAFPKLRRSFFLLLFFLFLQSTPQVRSSPESSNGADMQQKHLTRFLMVPHKRSQMPSRIGPLGSHIRNKNQPLYQKTQQMTTSNALVECREGSFRVDGLCVQLISSPTKLGCDEGWIFNNGICIGYEDVPTQLRCDEGYTLDSGQCTKTQETPKEMFCPDEFELVQDSCLQTVRVLPDMYCPPGFQFIGNLCHSQSTQKPIAQCPPEYFIEQGKCAREVIVPGKLTCATGSTFDGNLCVSADEREVLHGCQKGFIKEGHTCVRHFNVNVKKTCLKRSQKSEVCEEHIVCPAGCTVLAKAAICECIDTRPTERSCPKPYHLRADSTKCVKYGKQPASIYCPRGFFPFHGQCKKIHMLQADKVCPTEYVVGVDGLCQSKFQHEPIPKCSAECSLVLQAEGPICESQKKVSPKTKCPNGFSVWKNRCIHKHTKPMRSLCPLGFNILEGANCVRRVEKFAIVMCPVGFTHQFGSCVKQIVSDSIGLCPPGFGYDRQTEECFKMLTSYDFYNSVREEALFHHHGFNTFTSFYDIMNVVRKEVPEQHQSKSNETNGTQWYPTTKPTQEPGTISKDKGTEDQTNQTNNDKTETPTDDEQLLPIL